MGNGPEFLYTWFMIQMFILRIYRYLENSKMHLYKGGALQFALEGSKKQFS